MARYAVEHIWEGKQEYFLIRDHQSWQMVLLPSKYLTHLIRANRSPNTVGRRAKSIRFYLEYLDEKEMELSQVAENMRKESALPLPHRNSFFESMRQFCFSSFFSDIYIDCGLSPQVKLPV